jgi:hypothetical protein
LRKASLVEQKLVEVREQAVQIPREPFWQREEQKGGQWSEQSKRKSLENEARELGVCQVAQRQVKRSEGDVLYYNICDSI